MIKKENIINGPRVKVKETYIKNPTTNKSAEKKQLIVEKYPESFQLNLIRKAIIGDEAAKATLQEIEDFINSL